MPFHIYNNNHLWWCLHLQKQQFKGSYNGINCLDACSETHAISWGQGVDMCHPKWTNHEKIHEVLTNEESKS
jgi:hypothetical protein